MIPTLKKTTVIELDNDNFRVEYHGRHKALLLVCKQANDGDKVIKYNDLDPSQLVALSELLRDLATAIREDQK